MLVSENRPEWLIADIAIMSIGAIAVPAYTTNTAVNHLHIINDSGARVVIVSTPQLARHVIAAATEADQKLVVYVMDEPEKTMRSDVEIRAWADLLTAGANQPSPPPDIVTLKRDEVCCLIYTSGTGGLPRGVMLTHGNILCNCAGATEVLRPLGIGEEVFLSSCPCPIPTNIPAGSFSPSSSARKFTTPSAWKP